MNTFNLWKVEIFRFMHIEDMTIFQQNWKNYDFSHYWDWGWVNILRFNHVIGYDLKIIIYANFQTCILKHGVAIQEKIDRQSSLFHLVVYNDFLSPKNHVCQPFCTCTITQESSTNIKKCLFEWISYLGHMDCLGQNKDLGLIFIVVWKEIERVDNLKIAIDFTQGISSSDGFSSWL